MTTERNFEWTSDKFNITMTKEQEHEETRNIRYHFQTDSVRWKEQLGFQTRVQYLERDTRLQWEIIQPNETSEVMFLHSSVFNFY
jgi:hypothetical protein